MVSTIRVASDGDLQLEFRTSFASQTNQPDVSWQVTQLIAALSQSWSTAFTSAVFGSEDWGVQITTYSNLGNYRYQSRSTLDLLKQVYSKSVTYQEWLAASGAGFK